MSKEFLFLSGRISALESKLITFSQLERMVMAETPERAFRILVELQYAEFFDDSTKPQDFLNIINRGLLETKQMILDGTDNDSSFEFIWKNFDLNNIKRALKIKLLDKKDEVTNFSEDNGFNWLGSLSEQDIQLIIFKNERYDKIPKEYQSVLRDVDTLFDQDNDFRRIELLLDKAHFHFLSRISQGRDLVFLKNWLEIMADTTNMKTVARNLFLFNQPFTREMFLSYGKNSFKELSAIDSIDSFNIFFKNNEYFALEDVMTTKKSLQENVLNLEKTIEVFIDNFLNEAEADSLGGLEVPLVYLHKRIKNARKIKFVMFSKFYGMDSEKIHETLKSI